MTALRDLVRANMERLLPPRGQSRYDDGRRALARRIWPEMKPSAAYKKLRRLARCETQPSDEQLEAVAQALGVSASEFYRPVQSETIRAFGQTVARNA